MCGGCTHWQATDVAAGLRRERDSLWAEAENLRCELDAARREKAEVAGKLAALRTEVRGAVEEAARERDARLAAASGAHEAMLREVRAEGDRRLAAAQAEHEARTASGWCAGRRPSHNRCAHGLAKQVCDTQHASTLQA